ncbi:MAG: ATP-binding cassette domain-containing protein [Trueperaceae bacterium]
MITNGVNTAIGVHQLSKRYGGSTAVDGISFEVGKGEVVGFLGPNGAGKTTTLRMLAGLVRPSGGSCEILGQAVRGPTLREVGTMIEEPSFYPYLSGRANLQHAALLHGGVRPRRIDEVLEFVGMELAAGKRVSAYSQGMRQRLGLARSLLWSPEVLLLDEPTNGLDPVGIAEVRDQLREVARRGVTVLISSHILSELEKLVGRVLVIEQGRLLYAGSLDRLIRRIDEQLVPYLLLSTDADELCRAAETLGHRLERLDDGRLRIWVPDTESDALIGRLSRLGVELIDARRESDSLEGAYLRLLKQDGRPS